MENFKDYLKNITLFVLWLCIPPIYPFLAVKWKTRTKKKAILHTFLSPLMIVFTLVLLVGFFEESSSFYNENFYRGSISEIESKTEIEFPSFKTVEKDISRTKKAFNGDWTKSYTVKLNSDEIKDYYSKIDHKILETQNSNDRNWSKTEDNHYHFSQAVQYRGEPDEFLELDINKETNTVTIKYGCW